MKASQNMKLEQTINTLARLKSLERALRWDEIKRDLAILIEGIPFVSIKMDASMKLYRGRRIEKEHFNNTKLLSNRNSEDIMDYGRCHSPGKSILYCSSNLETAFEELNVHVGDDIQTLDIEVKADESISCIVVGEYDFFRRYGRSNFSNEDISDKIESYLKELPQLERIKLNITDAFIAEQFSRPVRAPYEYKLTSAFCDLVFENGVEAIFYPSVGHKGGWNLAIRENAVNKLEFMKSSVHHIYDVMGFGIFGSNTHLSSSSIQDQLIQWTPKLSEKKFFDDFDVYLRYHYTERTGNTLLFQFFSYCEQPSESMFQSQSDAMKLKLKYCFNGSCPLALDLDLNKLIHMEEIKIKHWDLFYVDVVNIDDSLCVQQSLENMRKNLLDKKYLYNIFDRKAKLQSIASLITEKA